MEQIVGQAQKTESGRIISPEEILKVIPHGKEGLHLDFIEEVNGQLQGVRLVKGEDCLGHFDEARGFPAIVSAGRLMEMAGQFGSYVLLHRKEFRGMMALFSQFSNCKFKRAVRPGNLLVLRGEEGEISEVVPNRIWAGQVSFQGLVKRPVFWARGTFFVMPRDALGCS